MERGLPKMRWKRGLVSLVEGIVEKYFFRFSVSVILLAALAGGLARAEDRGRGDKDRKDTTKIIVVEKRDRDKSGSGETKERRPDDRKPHR